MIQSFRAFETTTVQDALVEAYKPEASCARGFCRSTEELEDDSIQNGNNQGRTASAGRVSEKPYEECPKDEKPIRVGADRNQLESGWRVVD